MAWDIDAWAQNSMAPIYPLDLCTIMYIYSVLISCPNTTSICVLLSKCTKECQLAEMVVLRWQQPAQVNEPVYKSGQSENLLVTVLSFIFFISTIQNEPLEKDFSSCSLRYLMQAKHCTVAGLLVNSMY